MSRTKRRQPYDPSKAHDRRAKESNRGVNRHLEPIEVDDPFEQGAKIITMRNIRNDPLGAFHAKKQIDQAQFAAGREFQSDWEQAERGPGAIDPGKEFVDGGRMTEPITEGQRRAVMRLNRAERELGADGSAIVHDVLVSGLTMAQVGQRRGMNTRRWQDYFARRFRECLDTLAKVYGFASR